MHLTFTDPAIPLAWEFWAATLRFWSTLAVGLSVVACVMTYFAFREARASKSWGVTFWISGVLVIAVLLPLAFFIWSFDKPIHIHNQALLKAINADAQILMATKFVTTKTWSEDANHEYESGGIGVRKGLWPRAIASLSPQNVTVDPGQGVDIMTTGFLTVAGDTGSSRATRNRLSPRADLSTWARMSLIIHIEYGTGLNHPPKHRAASLCRHHWSQMSRNAAG
jgi:hypothetical protein